MEIRLIKTFQTIVKLGNFQRAAEALQYSQPTITIQIKKLEEELGMKLFERGKTITLTSAGRLFHERADMLLREYDELNSSLTDFIQGDAGVVRVGASEPSASSRLPGILSAYTEKKPKVQIKVKVGTTRELMQMVIDDEIDLALCNQPEPHIELEFHGLMKEQFSLLLPAGHPFAERAEIRMKDLRNEKFLFTPGTCSFRIRIEEMITKKIGKLRHNSIEVASISALKYYVQAQLGIALSPVVAVSPPLPGTIIKQVIDMAEGPELGILIKRNSTTLSQINKELITDIKLALTPDPDW